MLKQRQSLVNQGVSLYEATNDAAEHVVLDQQQHTSVPRRFSTPAKEIWAAQNRLEGHTQAKPKKVMAHPRFRAAYDFLLLRVLAQPELQTQVEYWTEMQQRYPELAQSAARHKPKRGGRRPRRRKHPAKSASH